MNQELKTPIIEDDVGIYIDPSRRAIVSIALFVAVFGCNFSFRSYGVALPSIVANWTYSSFLYSAGNSLMTVAMTVATLIVVKLSAKTGLKKTIIAGLVIVLICDIATVFAPNIIVFLVIRVFYGVGCGFICGQELSSLNLIWPSADRKRWVGMRGVTYSIASVIGPTVAGLIVDNLGWQATFYTVFVFHLFGLIVFALSCPADARNRFYKDSPFDYAGCIAFITFITAATLVCNLGNALGWGNTIIVAGLIIVVVSFIALLKIESGKASGAILPLDLFKRNSNFTKLFFISVFACIVNMAPVNFLALYLQRIGGTSATASGLPCSLIYLVTLFFTFTISRIDHLKSKKVLIFCSLVGMVVIGVLAAWLSPNVGEQLVTINIIAACYGIGNAITTTTIYDAVAEYVETVDIGISTSLLYMGTTFGGSVGLSILQLIMNTVINLTSDMGAGIKGLFWGSFAASVVVMLLALSLKDDKKRI